MFFFGKKNEKGLFSYIRDLFSSGKTDKELEESLRKLLYEADLGPSVVEHLMSKLRHSKNYEEASSSISQELTKILSPYEGSLSLTSKPYVIMMVGVNGVGKTTAAAKLANWFKKEQGKKVMLAAGDTFRAAAVEQLEHWSQKIGCEFFSKGSGADPGAVGYESVAHAVKSETDVLIMDTGGRLHTQGGLMAEISKVHKAVTKSLGRDPDQVILVVDSTQGQNIQNQAEIFNDFIQITGLMLTKFDGTAKGGAILRAVEKLKRPVFFLGTGESLESLSRFDSQTFISKLL